MNWAFDLTEFWYCFVQPPRAARLLVFKLKPAFSHLYPYNILTLDCLISDPFYKTVVVLWKCTFLLIILLSSSVTFRVIGLIFLNYQYMSCFLYFTKRMSYICLYVFVLYIYKNYISLSVYYIRSRLHILLFIWIANMQVCSPGIKR